MRFKNLERKSERESPKRTISTNSGLYCYKWYQSQTSANVPAKRLNLEGGGHEAVCPKDTGPKGGGLRGPTSIGEGTSARDGAGPERG